MTNLSSLHISSVLVLDQDAALDFYCGQLGFEVQDDLDLGFMRWLTIALPGETDRRVLLELPGGPGRDEAAAAALRDLMTKGALGSIFLTSTDAQADFERLDAAGVEIVQEPTQQPFGLDFGLRDPFGNHVRVTQRNHASGEAIEREYQENGATFS